MIPMLIMYVLKQSKYGDLIIENIKNYKQLAGRIVVLLAVLLVTGVKANNSPIESQSIIFNVINKNKLIGAIYIDKFITTDSVTYTLESNIKTKLILKFNIHGKERSIYKRGKLVYSSVYRKLNNKVKIDQEVVLMDNQYFIKSTGNVKLEKEKPIDFNLVKLFFIEPIGIKEVYCDKLKRYVPIEKMASHRYKVIFNKDNYSIFNYENGVCISVNAIGSFFKVKLERYFENIEKKQGN
jgi:hypothetical protein